MNAKQIMAFDHVGIALFDECGKSPKSVSLGFFAIVLINNDQFLPAIDGDEPSVLQIAAELFCLDAKIDYIRGGPDKWVERLDVGNGRSICFAAMYAHSPAFAQFNGHDPRCRISAKEQRVFLEFHIERFLDFARND